MSESIFAPFFTFLLGVLAIYFFYSIYKSSREWHRTLSQRSSELGWEYHKQETWQANEAMRSGSFRILYSITGEDKGITWALIHSGKESRVSHGLVSGSSNRRYHALQSARFDWRSHSVSVPQMVFLKYKTPELANQVMGMMKIDTHTYVNHLLDLGIIEDDKSKFLKIPFIAALISGSKPFPDENETDFGLQLVEGFEPASFEVYAQSAEAAQSVLNNQAIAALEAWERNFEQRFPENTAGYFMKQPMILLFMGGVYLSFDSEETDLAAVEAIVELGTALVHSQN
jgi:hypothetical protein